MSDDYTNLTAYFHVIARLPYMRLHYIYRLTRLHIILCRPLYLPLLLAIYACVLLFEYNKQKAPSAHATT